MDCYDPEISINIVDLGLVYRIELVDDSTMPSSIPMLRVEVDMSLTTPGYPVSANPRSNLSTKLESRTHQRGGARDAGYRRVVYKTRAFPAVAGSATARGKWRK